MEALDCPHKLECPFHSDTKCNRNCNEICYLTMLLEEDRHKEKTIPYLNHEDSIGE